MLTNMIETCLPYFFSRLTHTPACWLGRAYCTESYSTRQATKLNETMRVIRRDYTQRTALPPKTNSMLGVGRHKAALVCHSFQAMLCRSVPPRMAIQSVSSAKINAASKKRQAHCVRATGHVHCTFFRQLVVVQKLGASTGRPVDLWP